jgi:hypothetical protein
MLLSFSTFNSEEGGREFLRNNATFVPNYNWAHSKGSSVHSDPAANKVPSRLSALDERAEFQSCR